MSSTLSVSREFFTGRFTAEYRLELPLTFPALGFLEFAADLATELLPNEALSGKSLLDLKGRDSNNLLHAVLKNELSPSGHELFFISGAVPMQEESAELDRLTAPFKAYILTPFESFEGAAHIYHSTKAVIDSALPDLFAFSRLKDFPELELKLLRVGIDLYQPHTFGFIGFAPIVTQTLLIECTESHLSLGINAARLKSREVTPLKRLELFQKLSEVLKRRVGFDLEADYTKASLP